MANATMNRRNRNRVGRDPNPNKKKPLEKRDLPQGEISKHVGDLKRIESEMADRQEQMLKLQRHPALKHALNYETNKSSAIIERARLAKERLEKDVFPVAKNPERIHEAIAKLELATQELEKGIAELKKLPQEAENLEETKLSRTQKASNWVKGQLGMEVRNAKIDKRQQERVDKAPKAREDEYERAKRIAKEVAISGGKIALTYFGKMFTSTLGMTSALVFAGAGVDTELKIHESLNKSIKSNWDRMKKAFETIDHTLDKEFEKELGQDWEKKKEQVSEILKGLERTSSSKAAYLQGHITALSIRTAPDAMVERLQSNVKGKLAEYQEQFKEPYLPTRKAIKSQLSKLAIEKSSLDKQLAEAKSVDAKERVFEIEGKLKVVNYELNKRSALHDTYDLEDALFKSEVTNKKEAIVLTKLEEIQKLQADIDATPREPVDIAATIPEKQVELERLITELKQLLGETEPVPESNIRTRFELGESERRNNQMWMFNRADIDRFIQTPEEFKTELDEMLKKIEDIDKKYRTPILESGGIQLSDGSNMISMEFESLNLLHDKKLTSLEEEITNLSNLLFNDDISAGSKQDLIYQVDLLAREYERTVRLFLLATSPEYTTNYQTEMTSARASFELGNYDFQLINANKIEEYMQPDPSILARDIEDILGNLMDQQIRTSSSGKLSQEQYLTYLGTNKELQIVQGIIRDLSTRQAQSLIDSERVSLLQGIDKSLQDFRRSGVETIEDQERTNELLHLVSQDIVSKELDDLVEIIPSLRQNLGSITERLSDTINEVISESIDDVALLRTPEKIFELIRNEVEAVKNDFINEDRLNVIKISDDCINRYRDLGLPLNGDLLVQYHQFSQDMLLGDESRWTKLNKTVLYSDFSELLQSGENDQQMQVLLGELSELLLGTPGIQQQDTEEGELSYYNAQALSEEEDFYDPPLDSISQAELKLPEKFKLQLMIGNPPEFSMDPSVYAEGRETQLQNEVDSIIKYLQAEYSVDDHPSFDKMRGFAQKFTDVSTQEDSKENYLLPLQLRNLNRHIKIVIEETGSLGAENDSSLSIDGKATITRYNQEDLDKVQLDAQGNRIDKTELRKETIEVDGNFDMRRNIEKEITDYATKLLNRLESRLEKGKDNPNIDVLQAEKDLADFEIRQLTDKDDYPEEYNHFTDEDVQKISELYAQGLKDLIAKYADG
jgi:hypothetical protein